LDQHFNVFYKLFPSLLDRICSVDDFGQNSLSLSGCRLADLLYHEAFPIFQILDGLVQFSSFTSLVMIVSFQKKSLGITVDSGALGMASDIH
jgi:hypothetical protein